ncbi:hypothetical protein CLOM_g12268 [Closterium sp. NIES-68]|nr:hypothetical protein CLOM_g12268 [Closterium sp. NIES-68]
MEILAEARIEARSEARAEARKFGGAMDRPYHFVLMALALRGWGDEIEQVRVWMAEDGVSLAPRFPALLDRLRQFGQSKPPVSSDAHLLSMLSTNPVFTNGWERIALWSTTLAAAGQAGRADVFKGMVEAAEATGLADGEWWEAVQSTGLHPHEGISSIFISVLCVNGQLDKAMDVLEEMQQLGFTLTPRIFDPLLRQLARSKLFKEALALADVMRKMGAGLTVASFSSLIEGMPMALEVVAEMRANGVQRNSYIYTPIIHAFCKQGKLSAAIRVLREMMADGIQPNVVVFTQLHGVPPNDYLHAAMVELHHKTGDVNGAMQYLAAAEAAGHKVGANAVSALVEALAAAGRTQAALDAYQKGREQGVMPLPYAVGTLIMALGREGKWEGVTWQQEMRSGHALVVQTLACLAQMNDVDRILEVAEAIKDDPHLNRQQIFDQVLLPVARGLPDGNGVCLIGVRETLRMFQALRTVGVQPSRMVLEALLDSCAAMGDLPRAQHVMDDMHRNDLPPTIFTLFRLFRTAITAEDENAACDALRQMSPSDLLDEDVQLLVLKALEPFIRAAADGGEEMALANETLPRVREEAYLAILRANALKLQGMPGGGGERDGGLGQGNGGVGEEIAEILASQQHQQLKENAARTEHST